MIEIEKVSVSIHVSSGKVIMGCWVGAPTETYSTFIALGASEGIARNLNGQIAEALGIPDLARSLLAEPQPVPELKYSEAEGVGAGLFDHLDNLGLCIVDLKKGHVLDPEAILQRGELAWADMVQRVVALAREKAAEREG